MSDLFYIVGHIRSALIQVDRTSEGALAVSAKKFNYAFNLRAIFYLIILI